MAVIGNDKVNLLSQFQPANAPLRANTINGVNMQNTIGSLPLTQNMGLQKQLQDLLYRDLSFKYDLFEARDTSEFRSLFTPCILPKNKGTLSATFTKFSDMDDAPETAAVKGLEAYNQTLNEVSIDASAIVVSTAAYGRYAKNHRLTEEISAIPWAMVMAQKFATNAAATMDNLAAVRLYEGSSKLYVKTADEPADRPWPDVLTPQRITLGSMLSEVAAPLTWDALDVAKYLLQNYQEVYTVVNQSTGAKEEGRRVRPIRGYFPNGAYLVLLSHTGYNQLMNDPHFKADWVQYGGLLAAQVQDGSLGVNSPYREFMFKKTNKTLTVNKSDGKISTNGTYDLEVAFVIGGGDATLGVELTLEGSTETFRVGYNDDRKVDPLGMLSFYGWLTITDFTVVHNECIYAIPYTKKSPIKSGQAQRPASPSWNK